MTALAPTLQAFFTDRLMAQQQASPHTIAAYRDTWRLLLGYALHSTGKHPADLDFADLDAPLIGAFLTHLETDRGNGVTTRKRPADRDPLLVPLRGAAPARARGADRPGVSRPRQTA